MDLRKSLIPPVLALAFAAVAPQQAAAVEFWGNIIAADNWSSPQENYGVYSFKASPDDFAFTLKTHKMSMKANGSGVYLNGLHYWVTWSNEGWFMGQWYADDPSDGWRNIDGGEFYNQSNAPADLTYSTREDAVYGIFNNGAMVGTLDFSTFSVTKVTDIYTGFPLVAIACDKNGTPYWIDSRGEVSFWNTQYGFGFAQAAVSTSVSAAEAPQSAAFDPESGRLYWAAVHADNTTALYEIDVTAKSCTKVVDFPHNEQITSLHVPVAEAPADTPAKADALTADFPRGATEGNISFTLPSRQMDGAALEGTLSYEVSAGNTAVASGTGAPGEKVSLQATLPSGPVTISVIVSNANGKGAEAKLKTYIGFDEPEAPADVRLSIDGNTASLTWKAPAVGVNDGYIDAEGLRYVITRRPGDVEVAAAHEGCVFSETLPDGAMTLYSYTVRAVNGPKTGAYAVSNTVAAGTAFDTPYLETFDDRTSFALFTVIDVNHDWSTWMWHSSGVARCSNSYYSDNDDWLITPPVHLKSDRTYEVSFRTMTDEAYFPQLLTVTYGKADEDPMSYSGMIMPLSEIADEQLTPHGAVIRVESEGNYRLAFRCTSESGFYSLSLKDISIKDGSLLNAPAACTSATATPGAKGALTAEISFTAPQATLGGEPVKLSGITVSNGTRLVGEITAPEGGARYTVTDNDASEGMNTYTITAYSSDGLPGEKTAVECYAGIDTPAAPEEINLIDNGDGTATMQWSAAPETGAHGGYVDPAGVTYNVYTAGNDLFAEGVTDLTFNVGAVAQTDVPSSVIFRLTAVNEKGESAMRRSGVMILGPSAPLPFAESFPQGKAVNDWFVESPNSRYSFHPVTPASQDGDFGSNSWQASAPGEDAWIGSMKIALSGAVNPTLTFWYYARPGMELTLETHVSKAGKETVMLGKTDYATLTGEEGWRKAVYPLSGMSQLPYVTLRFHASAGVADVPVAIDNIRVTDLPAHDYGVTLSTPVRATRGKELTMTADVASNGAASDVPYTLTLSINGSTAFTVSDALSSLGEKTHTFTYKPTLADGDRLTVTAAIESEGDADSSNDITAENEIAIHVPDTPAVTDLKASAANGVVTLEWTRPEFITGEITDSFEDYEPWAKEGFGAWTTVDRDGFTTFGVYGVEHPGKMEPMAFMVFNPGLAVGDIDETFDAHNGTQYLMCFDADPEEPMNQGDVRNDDWLISPELSGEAQTVGFHARSFSPYDKESIEILYSTTGDSPDDFVVLSSHEVPGEWTGYTAELPEGAVRFAVHVTSRNKFALMLDDATFTPSHPVLEGFNIYRDGTLLASVDKEICSFADTGASEGYHEYHVTACYASGESEKSNTAAATLSGIDGIEADAAPESDADIYSVSGMYLGKGVSTLRRLPAGIYIIGNRKTAVTTR